MAEVNLPSWSEISQAFDGLQLNSTAATWENILARLARIESRLLEHERKAASTLPPLRPEPDPPDGPLLYAAAQPQFQIPYYKQPPLPNTLPQSNPSSWWYPSHQREQHGYHHYDNKYPSLPPEPMSELYQYYPSPTPAPDDLYYHYQPMGELYPPVYNGDEDSGNSSNYNVDEYSPYTDFWHPEDHTTRSLPQSDHQPPHPPSGQPSCGSPTAAHVCQPPKLRSPYSWVDLPPNHIQYSGPAYAASTIAPTTTTQGRSCQEYPVDVQQPLLSPTSPYCSKLTPLAVTSVLIPLPPLSPASTTALLLAAAPPPPSAAIFLPCNPDRIQTLSIIPAAAAPSQVHECDGVNIHYKGMQTDGTIFKPTFEQGEPIDIELGRGQVMKRWLLVLGMCLGEKRKLKIPSKLNYGEHVFDPGGFLVVALWFPP